MQNHDGTSSPSLSAWVGTQKRACISQRPLRADGRQNGGVHGVRTTAAMKKALGRRRVDLMISLFSELCSPNHPTPRVINVDNNPSYLPPRSSSPEVRRHVP